MGRTIGSVKSVLGNVVVRAIDGTEKTVAVGDELLLGEEVITITPDSKLVITTLEGKDITILGNDEVKIDEGFLSNESKTNVVADLQKTILTGENLSNLEETASGGTVGANEATSSTGATFSHSGSISNVFEGYGELNEETANAREFSSSTGVNPVSEDIIEDKTQEVTSDVSNEPNVVIPVVPENVVDIPEANLEPIAPSQPSIPSEPSAPEVTQTEPEKEIGGSTPSPNTPDVDNSQSPTEPTPQSPDTEVTPPPVAKPEVPPMININVDKLTPVIDTDLSKFESQMGLKSKFFYLPPEGEAYISHAQDESNGWTLHSFQNIDQALDFASQGKVDATYQVKKIDFQSHKDEDLAKNTASSLEDSPLARFLGDNAHSLTAMEGTDYAVGKNELKGERSLNIMEGYLFLEKGKEYKFKSVSDDGIRIKIGDKILFNDEDALKGHHNRTMSSEDTYQASETGFYKLNIAHYDIGYGNATLKLFTIEDGKELTVGDYQNGGIPLFTDLKDIGFVEGKLGKIVGYKADINVQSDLPEGKEVDLALTTTEGVEVSIGKVVVDEYGKANIKHDFEKIPNERDVFKAEYKNENGDLIAFDITNTSDSNTVIVKNEANTITEDGEVIKPASISEIANSETIDTSGVSSILTKEEISSLMEDIPNDLLTDTGNQDTIIGLDNNDKTESNADIHTSNDSFTDSSSTETATDIGTIIIPNTQEDFSNI